MIPSTHLAPSGEPCRRNVSTFCDACGWVLKEDHQGEAISYFDNAMPLHNQAEAPPQPLEASITLNLTEIKALLQRFVDGDADDLVYERAKRYIRSLDEFSST